MAWGTLFELSASRARVASPTSPTLPPKLVAPPLPDCGAAHPARMEARTIEAAVLLRSACFIGVTPTFCLLGEPVEIGHALEQLVERIGDKLLRGAPVHGACEPQLEMTISIKAERKRRLGLGSRCRTRAKEAARSRHKRRRLRDDRLGGGLGEDWRGCRCRFGLWLFDFGEFVSFFVFVLARLFGAA